MLKTKLEWLLVGQIIIIIIFSVMTYISRLLYNSCVFSCLVSINGTRRMFNNIVVAHVILVVAGLCRLSALLLSKRRGTLLSVAGIIW